MNQSCPTNTIVLTVTKNMTIPNGKFSKKKSLHILHLNINNLLPKIDKIRFIIKQTNAAIIGISESKLDSSILNREVETVGYDAIRMDRSKR